MHEGRIAVSGTVAEVVGAQPARISFELGRPAPPLPVLSAAAQHDGAAVALRSTALQQDLTTLLAWAQHHDVALRRLVARHASLDDVFRAVRTQGRSDERQEVAA
ncbi:MAG: hypothetical protein GEV09_02020 [Pseudonocardiaceae bacterium]|nr:hypothetical protein [Pseudonocardiaceae bacterium]